MCGLVDVLIICPVDVEYRQLQRTFKKTERVVLEVEPISENCKSQFFVQVSTSNERKSLIDVCVVQALKQGILEAACLTSRLVMEMKPKLVISFGIAGLFDDDVDLGSVCYPETVIYYEPAKDSETILDHRPYDQGSTALLERLYAPELFACDSSEYNFPHTSRFNFGIIRERPLASGEKLVAAEKSKAREDAKTVNRHVIGVDMEAAGVACACKRTPPYMKPKFLAIKGFSDRATKASKNPDEDMPLPQAKAEAKKKQKKERETAAKNASLFLLSLLEHNCAKIERSKPSEEERTRSDIYSKLNKFKTSSFLSSVKDLQPNDRSMTRAVITSNVPVIYHFAMLNTGIINWVDLYFLNIVRKLQDDCGFIPHILISEFNPISRDIQIKVEKFLEKLFSEKKPWRVYWSSNIEDSNNCHRAYAEAHRGVSEEYFFDLAGRNLQSKVHTLQNIKTDRWLVFQIWLSRVMPTQVVLAFYKRKELYDKLLEVPGMNPIIIYGDILRLGEEQSLESKVHERMQKLGVEPASADPLIEWFEKELIADPTVALEALRRFLEYFEPLSQHIPNSLNSTGYAYEIENRLKNVIGSCDQEHFRLLNRFSTLMSYWKRKILI